MSPFRTMGVLMAACTAALAQTGIRLNSLEYFEAPGFSFQPYHND